MKNLLNTCFKVKKRLFKVYIEKTKEYNIKNKRYFFALLYIYKLI